MSRSQGRDCAGAKSPLVVTITEPDDKILRSEGQGGGKVQWKDLAVTPTIVQANQKGVVSLSRDPRISDGKTGHLIVTVPSHPDLRAELDIPFRYDVPFVSNFSGSPGMDGSNGLDGTSGIGGSPAPRPQPSPGETALTAPMAPRPRWRQRRQRPGTSRRDYARRSPAPGR
jgi:hypothetical protein